MGENVRVIVRCRPMNKKERESKCHNIIEIEDCMVSVLNPSDPEAPAKDFTYDSVYNEVALTETIYNDICFSLVENVLEGYNGTIFAYGQTGCGKTHTMQGAETCVDISGSQSQIGIIPRCFDHIFESISVANDVRYLALVSYLEIYNENIRDLLNLNEANNTNHALKEIPGVGITVPTLSTHTVVNAEECYKLLSLGNQNRIVGATLMNAASSRSHSIFTISLEQIQDTEKDNIDHYDNHRGFGSTFCGIRRGKLNLVDLAGSERQNKTGATGDRLKEATKINLSLSALGNVISALVDGKTKHVPYRDSKLTRLLQDSLGGNTKTLMISCISPASSNYDETLSTLRYASRAKNISNKPKINEDPKDAKLREYQEEIIRLKQQLDLSQRQGTNNNSINPLLDETNDRKILWLNAERAKIRQEMEEEFRQVNEAEHNKQKIVSDDNPLDIKNTSQRHETLLKTPNGSMTGIINDDESLQLQARKRIESIKRALIGGERADDLHLKNILKKRKIDAQRRLSALAHVLSRVNESDDRNLLQVHYTSIQQELNVKNEQLKSYRQKIKALEREVSDLQSEFQLDRADYLESIRRLERSLKFYKQLISKALPILRKDGKYWEPQEILQNSTWNDDFKIWKLPESSMYSFKLPPANSKQSNYLFDLNKIELNADKPIQKDHCDSDKSQSDNIDALGNEKMNVVDNTSANILELKKTDILNNYFRPNRQKTLDYARQIRGFQAWKDIAQRNGKLKSQGKVYDDLNNNLCTNGDLINLQEPSQLNDSNWIMSKTWEGGAFDNLFVKSSKLKRFDEQIKSFRLPLETETGNYRQQHQDA